MNLKLSRFLVVFLSGSDVSDAARCCGRSAINPNRYGNGGKFASVPYRLRADRAQGKKCRAGARSFCRWLELVASDSAVAGCGAQSDLRAKPRRRCPKQSMQRCACSDDRMDRRY
jgi:hypothetical protein